MPPEPGIHPRPDSVIHAMPALIPTSGAAGMKWVSGFPENQSKGLPYISGLIIDRKLDLGNSLAWREGVVGSWRYDSRGLRTKCP
ncbi:MAG: hypothetical protein EXS42_03610 [Lacunisphaera sp.]|nr:hypothetical protein [Lacunisphaera sp.]